jgi:hypothetical protein
MLFTLEEIGVEAAMILAVAAAVACFVTLLAYTLIERRELRRLAIARRRAIGRVEVRAKAPRAATGHRPAFPSAHGSV